MSYSKKIDIRLNSTANLAGVNKTKQSLNDLAGAVGKLGSVLGGSSSLVGEFLRNIIKGGIWQAGASALGYCYKKIIEYTNAAKEAEVKAAQEAKEANDERLKALNAYAQAADKLTQARASSINQNLKAVNEEIDATKELTKATLELQKAQARKNGDTQSVQAIDRNLDSLDTAAVRDKLLKQISATRERRDNAKDSLARQEKGLVDTLAILQHLKKAQANAIASAREEAISSTSSSSSIRQAKAATKAEAELRATENFKARAAQIADATKKVKDFQDKINATKADIKSNNLEDVNLRRRLKALDLSTEAKRVNAEADTQAAAAKEAARLQQEKESAALKAAQAEAELRNKLERELHQKRMADLKEELATQSKAAAPLRAVASAAAAQFDSAFALYRDPNRAKEAIQEEKAYQDDLNRLHTDAAKYGGAWRIAQLSQLMVAGDSEAQASTLAAWRKSKSFTPQIEAMVRASAAEKTRSSTEDELRKIEHNTANLAQKIEDLLTMKG